MLQASVSRNGKCMPRYSSTKYIRALAQYCLISAYSTDIGPHSKRPKCIRMELTTTEGNVCTIKFARGECGAIMIKFTWRWCTPCISRTFRHHTLWYLTTSCKLCAFCVHVFSRSLKWEGEKVYSDVWMKIEFSSDCSYFFWVISLSAKASKE